MGHQRSPVPSHLRGPARGHHAAGGHGPAPGPGRPGRGGGRPVPPRPLRGRLPQRRLRPGRHHRRVQPAAGRPPGQRRPPPGAGPAGGPGRPGGRRPPRRVGHLPAGRRPPRPPALGPGGRAVPGAGHGRGPRAAPPRRPGTHARAADPLPGGRAVVPAPAGPGGGPGGRRDGQRAAGRVPGRAAAPHRRPRGRALPAGAAGHRAGPARPWAAAVRDPPPDRRGLPGRAGHGHGPVRGRGPVGGRRGDGPRPPGPPRARRPPRRRHRRRRRRRRGLRRWRGLRGRLRRRGMRRMTLAGVGIGWRPELAGFAARRDRLGFAEVVAESVHDGQPLPDGLEVLLARGVPVVPHGVRLSLGSASEPDPARVAHLAGLAERLAAPLVSEHVAFVRGGGLEAGHLLPVPRTRETLEVLAGNVRLAQAELPVPLALEDVAALLAELLERTGAWLLLDVANLYANARNHGGDPPAFLDALPLERVAYVHVAGGVERDGLYHDTHAHPTPPAVLDLVAEVCARFTGGPPGVMLERDDAYPPEAELAAELDAIAAATRAGVT